MPAAPGKPAVTVGEEKPLTEEAGRSEPEENDGNITTSRERAMTRNQTYLMVKARRPNSAVITEDMARGSHMLEGVWNPIHVKQLMQTLMTHWGEVEPDELHDDLKTRNEALEEPAKASCDESIRGWTERENAIFLAYLNGELEPPHPPNFIKEVFVSEHRAMIEDMHEANFNYTLTAV
ncbi:hypothetical protein PHPALM_17333 [Phytophthora palmivora]|uniref:Uncharacterized protein n=1 Tax=Phytophthora palmivora TaxID=4796 RepID=A0A2P4XMI3_9STRA|nr:hypothetical protein PHPALM_17333 [Phytophthora palmivora]